MNGDIGAVILDNQSNSSVGLKVSADAVRFGGGMGNVARSEGVSGLRRWEEAAKYYAQFSGAAKRIFHHYDDSSDLYNDGFAQWMWAMSLHQKNAEDAALIRFHTNGAGGTGTETFTSPLRPESENVRSSVHDEVINDIRKGYYPGWVDRGKKNRGPYDEPPNFLFELAFHDRAYPDNTFLKDPKFRQLCARAICQGFVKYFANKDGRPVHLSPEPPRSFMVRNTPAGIQLKWEPPETDAVGLVGDGATSYVVYLSFDGKAWDNGRETVDTEYTFKIEYNSDDYVTVYCDGVEIFSDKMDVDKDENYFKVGNYVQSSKGASYDGSYCLVAIKDLSIVHN